MARITNIDFIIPSMKSEVPISISKTIRFPAPIYNAISKIAKEKEIDFSKTIMIACSEFILAHSTPICKHCQTRIELSVNFCPNCGYPLTEKAYAIIMRYQADMLRSHDEEQWEYFEMRMRNLIRSELKEMIRDITQAHRDIFTASSSPVSASPGLLSEKYNLQQSDSDESGEETETRK